MTVPEHFDRRRFLAIGGIGVATAAMFAACGSPASEDGTPDTTARRAGDRGDISILRTASSLEHLAVDVYAKLVASGLITTAAVADAATLFAKHHADHAALFDGKTRDLGSQSFTAPNPVVMRDVVEPALGELRDEAGVIDLALTVERIAAATYLSAAGTFKDVTLNVAVMSVCGIQSRHIAVLLGAQGRSQAPAAFATTDGAVAIGTGI